MTDTIIPPKLAEKLKQVASEHSMDVDTFVEAAMQTYLRQLEQVELQKNIASFEQMLPRLRQEYGEQYIAVAGGLVVDHDDEFKALHLRIRSRFGRHPVLIRQVSVGERTLSFHSSKVDHSKR